MRAATTILLLVCLSATPSAHPDRRIVDRITIGDVRSEQDHAYAGDDVTAGVTRGHAFRQARGWMRYALTVFDDTEVTVACTFAGSDAPQTFDVVVENHLVTTYTFTSADRAAIEFRVPLELTRGRTNILVMLRAASGSTTPALLELRSVQDHNE
ncbi:MAG: hypothetical protein JWM95_2724 [Gemmatimonadetes bacterium]|nr:hypothetical protein [Gemmatimonadota bacterium]